MARKAQEIYSQIKETNKERKTIKGIITDTLNNSRAYKEAFEAVQEAKNKLKSVKDSILSSQLESEEDKLSQLNAEMDNLKDLLSDVAMSSIMSGNKVVVEDGGRELEPVIKVSFKKA